MSLINRMRADPRRGWVVAAVLLGVWVAGGVAGWCAIVGLHIPVVAEPARSLPPSPPTTQPVVETPLEAYAAIWQRSLRQTLVEPPKPVPTETPVQERPVELELAGTAIERGQSFAFLRRRSGGIDVVGLGGEIDGFTLAAIAPARVTLTRDGVGLELGLPESAQQFIAFPAGAAEVLANVAASGPASAPAMRLGPSAPVATEPIEIRMGGNSEQFLRDVRLVPRRVSPVRQEGFRVDSVVTIQEASHPFCPGDVILELDGERLVELHDSTRLLESLDDGRPHVWRGRRGQRDLVIMVQQQQGDKT